jgi:hypothetical protein
MPVVASVENACGVEPCVARLEVFPRHLAIEEGAMTALRDFERIVEPAGQPTNTTLTDLFGQRDEALEFEMQTQLHEIREAETKAERQTAEVRLF